MLVSSSSTGSALACSLALEDWLPFGQPDTDPHVRVFCFAHAGGSATLYRGWQGGHGVEFYPVQLPGHGTRLGEAPLTRMDDLIPALATALDPLLDRPFALFGHSMGAWVAYEAARHLRTQYGQPAQHLFVSGNAPPKRVPTLVAGGGGRAPEDLRRLLGRLGGTASQLLENQELMTLLLPVFAADIGLLDQYCDSWSIPLSCSISGFCGQEDPLFQPEDIERWKTVTESEFEFALFPGGHFFIESEEAALTDAVYAALGH